MEPERSFYVRALARVRRNILYAAAAGALGVLIIKGWLWAALFACGAVAAYFGFAWLHQAVEALGPGATPRKRVWMLVVMRYALLGLGGYVIVKIFGGNAIAAVFGLFTPAVAIIVEILYELADGTGT